MARDGADVARDGADVARGGALLVQEEGQEGAQGEAGASRECGAALPPRAGEMRQRRQSQEQGHARGQGQEQGEAQKQGQGQGEAQGQGQGKGHGQPFGGEAGAAREPSPAQWQGPVAALEKGRAVQKERGRGLEGRAVGPAPRKAKAQWSTGGGGAATGRAGAGPGLLGAGLGAEKGGPGRN